MHRYIAIMTLMLTCGCRRSGLEKPTAEIHRWNATKPIFSEAWFVDGKYAAGGSMVTGAQSVNMTITKHADSVDYVVQYSPTNAFSDTIRWDPANKAETSSPGDGTLHIDGSTSIFLFRERAPDGKIVKTRELFLSDRASETKETR